MRIAFLGNRRKGDTHRSTPVAITSVLLLATLCMHMIGCSMDDLRRSFLARNQWLHREYHFGPPERTIHSLKINFSGEIVEAVEGDSILNPQFADPAYQQAVQEYMENELRGAGLLDSTKPEGDILRCRTARVSAQHLSEGFPLRKTAGEVELDCFLAKSGWRYKCTGRGTRRGQGPQDIHYSANIAIDDATRQLIMALAEQLGASGPE